MNHLFRKSAALAVLVCFLVMPLTVLGQAPAETGKAKVNINTAGLNELQSLPRVGPKLAQRILDYRKEHGSFKRPEDLLKVKGIGEKMFRGLKDQVTVGSDPQVKCERRGVSPSSPASLNAAEGSLGGQPCEAMSRARYSRTLRRACPLWLTALFSEGDNSANVRPRGG